MGPKVRAQPHTVKDVLKSNNTEVNTEGKRRCKENVDCCPKTVKNQQEGNTKMTMQKRKTTTLDPICFTSKMPWLNHHTQRANVTM
jgi:hypothetical protein